MDIRELQKRLDQGIDHGRLSFDNISKNVASFFNIMQYYSYASGLVLDNPNIQCTDSSNTLTVTGSATWLTKLSLDFNIQFKNRDDITESYISISLPGDHIMEIPGLDWFHIDSVSMNLQSIDSSTYYYLTNGFTGALSCKLNVDNVIIDLACPIPSYDGLYLQADLTNVNFPTVSDLAKMVGGRSALSIPDDIDKLGQIRLYKIAVGIQSGADNFNKLSLVSFEFGTAQNWDLVAGIFTLENFRVLTNVFRPMDSANRAFGGAIKGTVKVGRVEADLCAQKLTPSDSWTFSALIPEINLSDLAEKALSAVYQQVDLPAIKFKDTYMEVTPSTGDYSFKTRSGGDSTWDIPIAIKKITIKAVGIDAARTNGQLHGKITGTLTIGSVDFSAYIIHPGPGQGWQVGGMTGPDQNINLTSILSGVCDLLGVSLPYGIPEIDVKNLVLGYNTLNGAFTLKGDANTTLSLPIGSCSYDIQASLYVSYNPASKGLSAWLQGGLHVGNAEFDVRFGMGDYANTNYASWTGENGQTIGFQDLASLLGIGDVVSTPQGLDLSLDKAVFLYDAVNKRFTLSAHSKNYGNAFFTAGKTASGGMGFVFGVDFGGSVKLSDLPVIGGELKAADFLTIKQASILVSSGDFKDYVIPDLPPLPSGGTPQPVQPVAAKTRLQLTRGVSLAAIIDFASSAQGNKRIQNLNSVVGMNELVLQVAFTTNDIKLSIGLDGCIYIPTRDNTMLKLSNAGISIDITTEIIFQVYGSMSFSINGRDISATARLAIDETEAMVAVYVESSGKPLPPPPGINGLHLDSIGLAMGVFFAPPALDLGVQGKFKIGDVQTSDDSFAMVLQIIEEVPNPALLSFHVDRMDFGQIVTLFTNQSEPDIVKAIEVVKADEVSFYWAEQVVILPDGTNAQPGFAFGANLDIFGFKAHGDFELSLNAGIKGDAELDPINFQGVLKVEGDGAGINKVYQEKDGKWEIADNRQIVRNVPPLPTKNVTVVSPGGPVFKIDCTSSPYLHIDWQVSLFDIVKEKVDATIDNSGVTFDLEYNVAGIEKLVLSCRLASSLQFSAGASFVLDADKSIGPITVLGINCGSIHLQTKISAGISVSISSSGFELKINNMSFNFEGAGLSIPDITLNIAPSSLKEIPEAIFKYLIDNADRLFSYLFNTASQWAKLAYNGTITGFESVGGVLKDAFKLDSNEAARVMKDAGYAADQIGSMLKDTYNLAASAISTILSGLGFGYDIISKVLGDIFPGIHVDFWAVPHVDTPSALHVDIPEAVHVDFGTGGVHIDTPQTPHVDTPHLDKGTGPHVDFKIPPWGPHADNPVLHVDTPHYDDGIIPHVDTPAHVDTPLVPHTDTPAIPHLDTGMHIDLG